METPRVFRSDSHVVYVCPLQGEPRLFAFRWVPAEPGTARRHFEAVMDATEAGILVRHMEESPAFSRDS